VAYAIRFVVALKSPTSFLPANWIADPYGAISEKSWRHVNGKVLHPWIQPYLLRKYLGPNGGRLKIRNGYTVIPYWLPLHQWEFQDPKMEVR
jgi:hypothetical protein